MSAVGVPPKSIIDRLHAAGILVMNMVGHPKHAVKALDLGVDIVCAQGGEGGGHTGDIANSVLIPAVVDVARRLPARGAWRPGGPRSGGRWHLQWAQSRVQPHARCHGCGWHAVRG